MNVAHYEEALGKAPTRHLLLNALELAKISQSPHLDAEDFAQELFLGVWERKDEHDPDISTWVTWAKTLINHAVMKQRLALKAKKRRPPEDSEIPKQFEGRFDGEEVEMNQRVDFRLFLKKYRRVDNKLLLAHLLLQSLPKLSKATGLSHKVLRRRIAEMTVFVKKAGLLDAYQPANAKSKKDQNWRRPLQHFRAES